MIQLLQTTFFEISHIIRACTLSTKCLSKCNTGLTKKINSCKTYIKKVLRVPIEM